MDGFDMINRLASRGDNMVADATIDYNKKGHNLEIIRRHPVFVGDKKIPEAFIDNFYTIFDLYDEDAPTVTPDGKSLEDWKTNPRPSLIGNERIRVIMGQTITEQEHYREFERWVKSDLLTNHVTWDCAQDERVQSKKFFYSIAALNLMGIRLNYNDEQLFRYQQEYWRKTIYKIQSGEDSDDDSDAENDGQEETIEVE